MQKKVLLLIKVPKKALKKALLAVQNLYEGKGSKKKPEKMCPFDKLVNYRGAPV